MKPPTIGSYSRQIKETLPQKFFQPLQNGNVQAPLDRKTDTKLHKDVLTMTIADLPLFSSLSANNASNDDNAHSSVANPMLVATREVKNNHEGVRGPKRAPNKWMRLRRKRLFTSGSWDPKHGMLLGTGPERY